MSPPNQRSRASLQLESIVVKFFDSLITEVAISPKSIKTGHLRMLVLTSSSRGSSIFGSQITEAAAFAWPDSPEARRQIP
jgi:hypothetical protein